MPYVREIRASDFMTDAKYQQIADRLKESIVRDDALIVGPTEIEPQLRELLRKSIVLPLGSERHPNERRQMLCQRGV